MSLIPAFSRLRQEDDKFEASLECIVRQFKKKRCWAVNLATWETEVRRIMVPGQA
jgi:hypothetical protein